MPILNDIEPQLSVEAVLAGQGCDPRLPASRRVHLLDAARRALAAGASLVSPRMVSASVEVAGTAGGEVPLERGRLGGEAPAERLRGATRIIAAVATLGDRLEGEVSRLMDADPLLALALDGYGTAALDDLVNRACGRIRADAHAGRQRATPPISPGMGGWPLADGQRDLFALVDASAIGVTLTSSSLMLPRKSVSFVVGVGEAVDDSGHACDWCSSAARCRYRCEW